MIMTSHQDTGGSARQNRKSTARDHRKQSIQ